MKNEAKPKSWLPDKWDKEADVVVIGYGGAGAITAITAFDAGASVIILEKSPSLASIGITAGTSLATQISGGGGNTHISMGITASPINVSDAANYLYAACGGQTPMDVCLAWAEEACRNQTWLEEMGIDCVMARSMRAEYPSLPGWSAMTCLRIIGGGAAFFARLDKHIQKRAIEVLFDSPGKELIRNYETGEIIGVRAENKGKTLTIKARKGVVLCTGGFEFNEEMKNRFLKCWPMKFEGWGFNTGDGIKMAQKVGADLWHMDVLCGGNCAWFEDPQYDFGIRIFTKTDNYIWVNKFGNRFCDERNGAHPHGGWIVYLERSLDYAGFSRIPSYLIFDEQVMQAGPLGIDRETSLDLNMWRSCLPPELGGYEGWSADNVKELERGWIKKGSTIEALAAAIGGEMDAVRLKTTIEIYNKYCTAGYDPEFGRAPESLQPLGKAPYYAIPLYPGLVSTCGGPLRSAKAEVLDPDRNPISRLYSAGTCGSIYGCTYSVTGGNLGELCAFGRIAGRNVAALQPWD